MNEMQRIEALAALLLTKLPWTPDIAVVLGSGLGDYAEHLTDAVNIPYSALQGFPVSTVQGHAGRFVAGLLGTAKVLCMQGRFHYYEGYDMDDVVLPVRVMARAGVKRLLLTNAAGGVNTAFAPGDLMMLKDHIALMTPNPLRGPNLEPGLRFPDMSRAYAPDLQQCMRQAAAQTGITLREGVYAMTAGPTYETPSEIRMWRLLGADAVGMSTAPEAIAAVHMGMQVAAVSCITNMAAGVLDQPLSHGEVMETADRAKASFTRLVDSFVALAVKGA